MIGRIGYGSFGEKVWGESVKKTATDIINFFSQENSEKVALWSDFGHRSPEELLIVTAVCSSFNPLPTKGDLHSHYELGLLDRPAADYRHYLSKIFPL